MKNSLFGLLLTLSLLVGGCTSTSKKKNHSSLSETSFDSSSTSSSESSSGSLISASKQTSGESSSISSTSIEPVEDGPIASISFKDHYIEAHVETTSPYALINYAYNDGYSDDNVDVSCREVTYELGDTSLASVDQYGRVTGLNEGKTTLTATTKINHLSCTLTVYVLKKGENLKRKLKKIENTEIKPGDNIILASAVDGVAAGRDDSGSSLNAAPIELNEEKTEITDSGNAAFFNVQEATKGRIGYHLEDPDRDGDRYLASTNINVVHYYASTNSSATLWSFTYSSIHGGWGVRPSDETVTRGWLLYNKSENRFTTTEYEPGETYHIITIFRLTVDTY